MQSVYELNKIVLYMMSKTIYVMEKNKNKIRDKTLQACIILISVSFFHCKITSTDNNSSMPINK